MFQETQNIHPDLTYSEKNRNSRRECRYNKKPYYLIKKIIIN
jgi:hypothetical protein